ncbi:hypothetical protein SAMN02910413_0808 [Pseudobutyrivibrio sp. C4]|uniref:hypothetical protein n=1 Tax=Pseudobutyrivibrio sp. C4 TaxID=1520803 RepID=UPI0008C62B3A|nr:hypothetical protein [Pseudobutyrivibrio sp. C4]SES76557.1 hypothetical protein SAMN02910413_0808 [Pseudobutyrivibrio sp. C4]
MKKYVKIIIAIAVTVAVGVGGFFGYRFYKQHKNDNEVIEEKETKPEVEEIMFVPVSEDEALSEKEWMALLNEALQYTDYTEYSDEKITGSEAVFSGMKKLGGACLDYYLDGNECSSETTDAIAKEKKLIEEDYLTSYIGEEQAKALINNLKALQVSEDYHVEKNDVVLADGVIDGKEWQVDYYKHIEEEVESTDEENPSTTIEQKDEVIASTGNYEPQVDDRIVYLDQYGIMHGGQVISVESRDGNKYDILTKPVETQEDLVDTYTVSGYVDWSIVTAMSSNESAFNPTISMCATGEGSQESTTTDMVISGSGGTDGISVDSVTLGGVSIYEADDDEEEEDAEEDEEGESQDNEDSKEVDDNKKEDKDEKKESEISKEVSAGGNFEITLKNLQIYAYVKDDEDVSFEISFEPAVMIDGIEAEAEIDLPNIPLGIGVLSADIDPQIAISADLGVSLGFGAEQPVCISSHSDPSGTAKSCNENAVKCKLANTDCIDADVDNTSVTLGFNLGVDLTLCEFINVADPNVTTSFVAVGKQLEKHKGYDIPCFEMKLAGPLIELDLSSEDSLLGYFLTEANVQSSFALNGINDDEKLLLAKYFHLEFEPLNVIQDPNGNASVCTHISDDVDHSKDMKIEFKYGDNEEDEYDEDADFFIEMNGQIFGFEFTEDEYEKQYLEYLNSISKDEYMKSSAHKQVLKEMSEPDIVMTIYDRDNADEYEQMNDGEFKILVGQDISELGFVNMHGYGPQYIHGHVVGRVTESDRNRYLSILSSLYTGDSFTYRAPYKNLAK